MHEMEADVVVVGGGISGTSTALNAEALGLRTALVSKGPVGKSGASVLAGHFHLGGTLLGGTAVNVEASRQYSIKYLNSFLVDQDYNAAAGEYGEHIFPGELERAGLYIRRDDDGTVVTSGGRARTMAAGWQGQTGVLLMDMRRKQIFQSSVRVLEEAMVTTIVQHPDGTVAGVTVLDWARGELYAIAAPVVVLATGHTDAMAPRSTATREATGDGLALAWNAGAELANLEIQWFHASDLADPPSWCRLHVYPNPLLGSDQTARLVNSRGETFFEQREDVPNSGVPYAAQIKAVMRQAAQKKARLDGGYYTSWAHVDPDTLRAYNSHVDVWDTLGLDVSRDALETRPTWHFRQGGVDVDWRTLETCVPGLLVAGALGAHFNGGIQPGAYDGTVAARTAASIVGRGSPRPLPAEPVAGERDRIRTALRPRREPDGPTPGDVRRSLQSVMWEGMGIVKSERSMNTTLDRLGELRATIPHLGVRSTDRRYNYSWADMLGVENMLTVAEITTRSARVRTESRGPFYREDHPVTDNEQWLCKNIIRPVDGGVEHRTEKYLTPYLSPDESRADWLSLDW